MSPSPAPCRPRSSGWKRSEHPRGAVQHVGAQLRHLLVSDHGVLGALGFAAAALTLAARDTFIGWDADQRSRQLHRVIGLSRFLIRSSVHYRNLALRRLPDDFSLAWPPRPARAAGSCASRGAAGRRTRPWVSWPVPFPWPGAPSSCRGTASWPPGSRSPGSAPGQRSEVAT